MFVLVNLHIKGFLQPIEIAMRSQFITVTVAARVMMENRNDFILMLPANAGENRLKTRCLWCCLCGDQAVSRQLAVELGRFNIIVVRLRPAGSPDAIDVSQGFDEHAAATGQTREVFERQFVKKTMLKHLPSVAEVANVAAIFVSEKATTLLRP